MKSAKSAMKTGFASSRSPNAPAVRMRLATGELSPLECKNVSNYIQDMHRTKLSRIGNSTGLAIPREVLAEAHLERGDEVVLAVENGQIKIAKADDSYNRTMEIGRRFAARYRRTMAALAK